MNKKHLIYFGVAAIAGYFLTAKRPENSTLAKVYDVGAGMNSVEQVAA